MKQHMLFFDIDGTLLDDREGVIPLSTVRSLHRVRENGHLIFICTGRCKNIWPKDVLDIGFDGIVGGCGTNIFYHGEELLHAVLPQGLQRQVADDLIRYHIDGVLEGKEKTYFSKNSWMPQVKRIFFENGHFSPECQCYWEQEEVLEFDKMVIWFDSGSNVAAFREKYEKDFTFIQRAPDFYEIVPRGYSKATGIAFLCERLGISPKETVGFGDSTNDLPMLAYTGISVAMGSGNPDLFPAVDYVTAGVIEDGIEKALKKYQFI